MMTRHSAPACTAFALLFAALPAAAQDAGGRDRPFASVTYGPYVRADLSRAWPRAEEAYWRPPGFQPGLTTGDPEIKFDLDADPVTAGSLAVGFDWMNGLRADISVLQTGDTTVSGSCSSASDGSDCATHADIDSVSLQTFAVMANVFWSPLEATGSDLILQPFLVGGVGIARNEVDSWTRENAKSDRPLRTFSGDTESGAAWSIGAGASMQLTDPGDWPIILEASWRYYDFGEARGGTLPLEGEGRGQPVEALTFERSDQVISIGIRIPLKRY